jgi:hypothetical protein
MVVQIKESNHAKLELDLELQPEVTVYPFTYLRSLSCLTPNQHHKLRRLHW